MTVHLDQVLIVWIRSFAKCSQKNLLPFLTYLDRELLPSFNVLFLVATYRDEPIIQLIKNSSLNAKVKFVYADMHSFSEGLNHLIDATEQNTPVLSISQGIQIKGNQVLNAYQCIKEGAWVYGWEISSMHNDGKEPGLGWYNTAALYSKECITWMKTHPFPKWIDNGAEGRVYIDKQWINIGGNEEIVLMSEILKDHPGAYFILNTYEPLHLPLKVGSDISFDEKLKRKAAVADYYLRYKLNTSAHRVWEHLLVLSKSS